MNDFLTKFIEQSGTSVEILGFVGQFVFFTRFVVQWIASEKKKESVIPEAFWWISIGGSAIVLAYGFLHSPPLPAVILPQLCANVIYARNLVLMRRMKRRLAADLPTS